MTYRGVISFILYHLTHHHLSVFPLLLTAQYNCLIFLLLLRYNLLGARPSVMALAWEHISADFIRQYVTARFDYPGIQQALKQAMIDFLTDLGITPQALITPAVPPAVIAPPRVPHSDPPQKAQGEDMSAFLDTLDAYFLIEAIPVERHAAILLKAIRPEFRAQLTGDINSGLRDYNDLAARLRQSFGRTFLDYWALYEQAKLAPGERFTTLATKLVSWYYSYLGTYTGMVDVATKAATDVAAAKAINGKLLTLCPSFCKQALVLYYSEHEDAVPLQLAQHVDHWLDQQAANRSLNKDTPYRAQGPSRTCSVHGAVGHTDSECRAQQRRVPQGVNRLQSGNATSGR